MRRKKQAWSTVLLFNIKNNSLFFSIFQPYKVKLIIFIVSIIIKWQIITFYLLKKQVIRQKQRSDSALLEAGLV